MDDKLDLLLQAGERLLYREDDDGLGWHIHVAIGVQTAVVGQLLKLHVDFSIAFLAALLTLLIAWTIIAGKRGTGSAVETDQRVLRLKGASDQPDVQEIPMDDVAKIEVLEHSVRVSRRDGQVDVVDHLRDAPAFGLALADAAGTPRPWVPRFKEYLAQEVAALASLIAGALAYALAYHVFSAHELAMAPKLSAVLAVVHALGPGAAGLILGLMGGLALLRPHLTHAEMRAWMRQSPIFAPRPYPGARSNLFTRFCLRFVDSLYDTPAAAGREEADPGG